MDIILASASPRRAELLSLLGLSFRVIPAAISEQPQKNENAPDLVQRLAREKAAAIAKDFPTACVIAADTVVVAENTILGKPRDDEDALKTLRFLAGKQHQVLTGVAIFYQGQVWQEMRKTTVEMIDYEEGIFSAYVESGEPRDKAGGYGIQGRGGILVKKIEGDFYNVVGLSLQSIREGFIALGLTAILSTNLKEKNDRD